MRARSWDYFVATATLFIYSVLSFKIIRTLEDAAVKRSIHRVVDEYSTNGGVKYSRTTVFEKELTDYFGAPILGTSSGTVALILVLKALKIGPGDEVIVPAFSFISTASVVSWVGAKPVFVDIQEVDFALNPARIEERISLKTKAIIVAHLFGQPAESILEILEIARKHNIPLVEDIAQAFGAKLKIKNKWLRVGTIGDIGCCSFAPSKPFSTVGNGGAIIFNNQALNLLNIVYRMMMSDISNENQISFGSGARLQEVQAAALIEKYKFFNFWLAYRKVIVKYYDNSLSMIENLELPHNSAHSKRIWYRYIIKTEQRDALFAYIKKNQPITPLFSAEKLYPVLLPSFSIFADGEETLMEFPIASKVALKTISLPMSHFSSYRDYSTTVRVIRNFCAKS